MSSNSSVRKNKLSARIEEEGYHSVVPCDRCVRLNRICVRADCSDRCSDCVKGGGGVKCIMSNPTFTDAEWRRLVKSQNSLEAEEERILAEQEQMLAKLMRLRKQKRLLRKRAGDFIARDYKEIAELEELERREAEELARIEKERVDTEKQKSEAESARAASEVPQSAAVDDPNRILAATSDGPSLTQMMASVDPLSPVDWGNIDFDAFFPSAAEASSSPSGNTVEPAGGSPSGSK